MLNRVVIMGRIGKDLELRYTQSGVAVTGFSLAVDRDFKDSNGEKATDWIDVVAWRNTAEFLCKYFGRGRVAVVEGRLQTRKWKDKDGNNRTSVEVVADNVYFGDSKKDGDGGYNGGEYGGGSNSYDNYGGYRPAGAPVNVAVGNDFAEIDEEDGDLPF